MTITQPNGYSMFCANNPTMNTPTIERTPEDTLRFERDMARIELAKLREVLKTALEHAEGKGWRSDHVRNLLRSAITQSEEP